MPASDPDSISNSSSTPERRSTDPDGAATLGLGPGGGAKRSQGAGAVSASIAMPLASKVHALGHGIRNPVLSAVELHRRVRAKFSGPINSLVKP